MLARQPENGVTRLPRLRSRADGELAHIGVVGLADGKRHHVSDALGGDFVVVVQLAVAFGRALVGDVAHQLGLHGGGVNRSRADMRACADSMRSDSIMARTAHLVPQYTAAPG